MEGFWRDDRGLEAACPMRPDPKAQSVRLSALEPDIGRANDLANASGARPKGLHPYGSPSQYRSRQSIRSWALGASMPHQPIRHLWHAPGLHMPSTRHPVAHCRAHGASRKTQRASGWPDRRQCVGTQAFVAADHERYIEWSPPISSSAKQVGG